MLPPSPSLEYFTKHRLASSPLALAASSAALTSPAHLTRIASPPSSSLTPVLAPRCALSAAHAAWTSRSTPCSCATFFSARSNRTRASFPPPVAGDDPEKSHDDTALSLPHSSPLSS